MITSKRDIHLMLVLRHPLKYSALPRDDTSEENHVDDVNLISSHYEMHCTGILNLHMCLTTFN